MDVVVVVMESGQIDVRTRAALRMLWDRAFGGRFADDDAVSSRWPAAMLSTGRETRFDELVGWE